MKEDLLQYIWQFQYFKTSHLVTVQGETIQIISPGSHNKNQGPDFTEAKIKIGDTIWAGNIELHVNSSHWNLHNHSGDANFKNVILHVVWNYDTEIKDINANSLPTVELKYLVSKLLLDKYKSLMQSSRFIPCENLAQQVNDLTLLSWKQRLAIERLAGKANQILLILTETNYHWEESFWRLIAANFGLKINTEFFLRMAKALPLSLVARHKNSVLQIESLLFGMTGLLGQKFTEKYPVMLQKEFEFYKKKYGLKLLPGKLSFLRMRPANFPTIRLAQLSVLIHESEHLFSKIKNASTVKEVKKMLEVTANDYWHNHYIFDEISDYKVKTLGAQMIDNIIINTVVPVLFAYGLYNNDQGHKDKAIKWLEEIASEKNSITKGFEALNFSNKSALDSQALIQLKNEYCNKKLCLQCAIGNFLLKKVS